MICLTNPPFISINGDLPPHQQQQQKKKKKKKNQKPRKLSSLLVQIYTSGPHLSFPIPILKSSRRGFTLANVAEEECPTTQQQQQLASNVPDVKRRPNLSPSSALTEGKGAGIHGIRYDIRYNRCGILSSPAAPISTSQDVYLS